MKHQDFIKIYYSYIIIKANFFRRIFYKNLFNIILFKKYTNYKEQTWIFIDY